MIGWGSGERHWGEWMSAGRYRWSQLRKDIESRFADSLKRRLRLVCVGYRGAHDSDGRATIVLDGNEIASFCNVSAMQYCGGRHNPSCHDTSQRLDWLTPPTVRTPDALHERGEFSCNDFISTCLEYRNLSIEDALVSSNPLHRALAMCDARVGKRRLQRLSAEGEHPLVGFLLHMRRNAEKLTNNSA
jgi:hypothetical protein